MTNSRRLSLKLIIDKKKNQVVFAESNKDFIDILFSFLTLPLGTIIRLIGKNSAPLGCFNTLYDSIKNLETKYFETEGCKNMLLEPRSESEERCGNLKINVNDQNPRRFYRCPELDSHGKDRLIYSLVPGAQCDCGKTLRVASESEMTPSVGRNRDGVFLEPKPTRFMVSEDFQVMEACTTHILGLLKKLGIQDEAILEEKDVDIGQAEVLKLLERSLLSKNPLSEIFLGGKQVKPDRIEVEELETKIIQMKELQTKRTEVEEIQTEIKEAKTDTDEDSNPIQLKLVINKDNGEVLYAEAEEEFVNLLFSFLTFPLASVIKFLNGHSSLGCMDNLYRSVEPLIVNRGVRYECKSMLLNPKLPPMFGCSDQILKLDEIPPVTLHYSGGKEVYLHNPKLPDSGEYPGGGFVEDSLRFILTGDLVVTLMSAVTAISIIKRLQVPITNLEEKTIIVGEEEALKILKASLISQNALSKAFSSRKRKRSNDSQDLEHASCQKCD